MESTELKNPIRIYDVPLGPARPSKVLCTLALALLALPLYAGTLRLGPPVVQNNQYTFPVYLQGNSSDVAALDFRLAYDPAVFSPVSAQSGPAAVSAQKQVSSNVAAPGEFIVVMMGFNQNVVQPGQVVELVLEKIGEPSGGQSELVIAEPTMATYEGVELDSNGLARMVRFGDDEKDSETDPETPTEPEAPTDDTPDSATPDPSAPNAPRTVGNFPVMVADGGAAGNTNSSASAATSAETGTVNAPTTVTPAPGEASPSASSGLDTLPRPLDAAVPQHGSPRESQAATAGPGEVSPSGTTTLGRTETSTAAETGAWEVASLAAEQNSGKTDSTFVTLLLAAIALPLLALLIVKVLR